MNLIQYEIICNVYENGKLSAKYDEKFLKSKFKDDILWLKNYLGSISVGELPCDVVLCIYFLVYVREYVNSLTINN